MPAADSRRARWRCRFGGDGLGCVEGGMGEVDSTAAREAATECARVKVAAMREYTPA